MITLAIQKTGRLNEHTTKLLSECGLFVGNGSTARLMTEASNFPMRILFLRDDDIPECVADGLADLGIVGENVYHEKARPLKIVERLGFAKCRLAIAVPKDFKYEKLTDLNGLSIATSYPNILRRFLNENNLKAEIHEISGSVEIAPGIGLASAIFDIVSTGSTLLTNGLKEVVTVLKSEAVLVASENLSPEKTDLLEQLLLRIRAVQAAHTRKYILLNAPDSAIEKICAILPGMKSPTIMPLAEPGWSSLHSVIEEHQFWERISALKAAGAQGILVIPIEKMIM
ncbi:MAG TPA: ATP phosphoribosyltransferase [Candidatus Marinimicrobia bacterium]|nr:ATP phosphoribosyltransferase [Candidatus Neomarinimicrobiota bacterium]HOV22804.1 ATP phosphoribosyltransferase [Candidatus Neomarinimicrobiota bacterium]HQH55776.1 ATP phosphoribosyltransferase [Candidatus Neomarinimicrobiota bacterium]HQK10481.1 ATP phosphoribosyltransferase [Candidatus Neomarinimicrobiota bacterium]